MNHFKVTYLIVVSVFLSACQGVREKDKQVNNDIVLSGTIINSTADTLVLLNDLDAEVAVMILNDRNSFCDTLNLKKGNYRLFHKKEYASLFLKSGFNVKISLDVNEFDKTLTCRGYGANENNYLAKKVLLEEGFGKLNYYGYYAKLPENKFLRVTDSIFHLMDNLLDSAGVVDSDFEYFERQEIKYAQLNRLKSFPKMKRYITKEKDFEVSEKYPKSFVDIDVNNEKLLKSTHYIDYVSSYIDKLVAEKLKEAKGLDRILTKVKTIKSEVRNEVIRSKLLTRVGQYNLNYTSELDSVFYHVKPYISENEILMEVTKKYRTLKSLSLGAPSPIFNFKDINEKNVSLTDLKGSLVYVDIWATWCLPCIKEIPHLKKLEEKFQKRKIHFVSICTESSKKSWEKMIENKGLKGIQLYASNENDPYFENYALAGIPRFILIDHIGNIIDAQADRPSSGKVLEGKILKYLKKIP